MQPEATLTTGELRQQLDTQPDLPLAVELEGHGVFVVKAGAPQQRQIGGQQYNVIRGGRKFEQI